MTPYKRKELLTYTYVQEDKDIARSKYISRTGIIWALALLVTFGLFSCTLCHAATLDQWADAINVTEGKGCHYGIKSVKFKNDVDARNICKRTVNHAWRLWRAKNGNSSDLTGFIDFLANRYCPPSVDWQGNINWKRNMTILMERI
jgi:hypothetical protein